MPQVGFEPMILEIRSNALTTSPLGLCLFIETRIHYKDLLEKYSLNYKSFHIFNFYHNKYHLNFPRIEGCDWMNKTIIIDLRFTFSFERAEHAIPDDEHSRVVLVDAVSIAKVMHSMMRRRVENPLERAQTLYDLEI